MYIRLLKKTEEDKVSLMGRRYYYKTKGEKNAVIKKNDS
jgi:hypothetical protein